MQALINASAWTVWHYIMGEKGVKRARSPVGNAQARCIERRALNIHMMAHVIP
jgi:hypothetical protein